MVDARKATVVSAIVYIREDDHPAEDVDPCNFLSLVFQRGKLSRLPADARVISRKPCSSITLAKSTHHNLSRMLRSSSQGIVHLLE